MSLFLLLLFLYTTSSIFSATHPPSLQHYCTINKCGSFQIPFPFYLNSTSSSCPTLSDAFSLSCVNSSSLFLDIASQSYRVLHFFLDGVLVDFPGNTMCRLYNDFKSFPFSGNKYFDISTENVLALNDCEDSSMCNADCDKTFEMPGCDGRGARYPSCCYRLTDHSSWRPGHSSLSNFSEFRCRGFSSWVVDGGSRVGMRGIKLEWAVPRNSTSCAANADIVNATSVASGIRCQCPDGFLGDGFPVGIGAGCFKSCFQDGKELRGNDCHRHGGKKKIIVAGVLITSAALTAVSLTALCVFKRGIRSESDKFVSDDHEANSQKAAACRSSQLFTYHELEEATKGFEDGQKIVEGTMTTLYAGVLMGSHVAIQRLHSDHDQCEINERLQILSAISHRNMAPIIGWSIDSALVVYDYPENGTLKEHLRRARDDKIPLEWYNRLNIATQTANILAYLHHEILPPIFHHDLQSGCIFLDMDFSVKLAGFELQNASTFSHCRKNDIYRLGVILVEIITGDMTMVSALQKMIKKGKLEEIVDPSLYYHEQAAFRREQIEIIADLATRCLLFGADGKLGMADVARELVHVMKDSVDGSSRKGPVLLEETFSNSSLLQMISMSPDSIYVP